MPSREPINFRKPPTVRRGRAVFSNRVTSRCVKIGVWYPKAVEVWDYDR